MGKFSTAVQVERDSITQNRPSSIISEEGDDVLSLTNLMVIDQTLKLDIQQSPDSSVLTTADLEDIYDSLESQLLMYLRWVKSMPILKELTAAETISMLRANAPAFVILELAWRSRISKNKLILQNGCAILRLNGKDCDRVVVDRNGRSYREISDVATKIINAIVKPFADVKLDQKEFVCLKALVFFNPFQNSFSGSFTSTSDDFEATVRRMQEEMGKEMEKFQKSLGSNFKSGNIHEMLQNGTNFFNFDPKKMKNESIILRYEDCQWTSSAHRRKDDR